MIDPLQTVFWYPKAPHIESPDQTFVGTIEITQQDLERMVSNPTTHSFLSQATANLDLHSPGGAQFTWQLGTKDSCDQERQVGSPVITQISVLLLPNRRWRHG